MSQYPLPVALVVDDFPRNVSKVSHGVHGSKIDLAFFGKFSFDLPEFGYLLEQAASAKLPVLETELLFEVHDRHTGLVCHDLLHTLLNLFLSLL